jgi:hypothetical protein
LPSRPRSRARRAESLAHDASNASGKPAGASEPLALFDPSPADAARAADPDALARAATLASKRAMKAGRLTEAKALAGLAETYARLTDRTRGGGQTIETMDLKLLFAVLTDETGAAAGRMALSGDFANDPDLDLKRAYHTWMGDRRQAVAHHQMAMLRRLHAAHRQIKDMGGEVTVSQSGFDQVKEARDWLLNEALELDEVAVTPSPPPGNPWNIGL